MKTPHHITLFRRARSTFDHLTAYLLFPSIKIREDIDYDTTEKGVTFFEIDLPTNARWAADKDHWTVSVRLLGFGLTLTRQSGY